MYQLSVKSTDPELLARLASNVRDILTAYEKISNDAHDKRGAALAIQTVVVTREV
jgi:hypothetical protein